MDERQLLGCRDPEKAESVWRLCRFLLGGGVLQFVTDGCVMSEDEDEDEEKNENENQHSYTAA